VSSGLPSARPDRLRALGFEPAPPDEDQTAWLVTFSDLVLQLFAFVLVSVVLAGAASPPPAAALAPEPPPAPVEERTIEPERDTAASRLAEVARGVREALATDAVQVAVRDSDVIVTLSDTITFPSGSGQLLPAAVPILRRIGALARAMPDFDVEVGGHTDDRPIHTGEFASNLELSLARAARVVHELAAAAPELGERAIAAGYGEHRPVAPNGDEEGRARNRRVEIRLLPHASVPRT
jgi:chemotaxis protein MotB